MRALLLSLGSSLTLCLACSPADTPEDRLPTKDSVTNNGGGSNDPGGTGGGSNGKGSLVGDDPEDPKDSGEIPEGCGDGALSDDEVCDDGNNTSGDGCAANCGQLEPGFSCAAPGKACFPLARCGDGVVAVSEQCDDGNLDAGDGCSDRCRVELGSKCEGTPSTCSPTTCGDGVVEGAEACDDGNTQPFDGCSSLCLREPNCEGLSCTSECGDGLVIDEDCDDGNQISGDGCSADCTIEAGFTCERATVCERINDECVLRVPVIYRDFTDAHPDFGGHTCSALAQGVLDANLNAEGKPVLGAGSAVDACMSGPDNFGEWFSDAAEQTHVSQIILFDNGRGGYVNRFDDQGNYFTATANDLNHPGGATAAACEASCREWVSNQEFNSGCNNFCNTEIQAAQQAPQRVTDATQRLADAIRQYGEGEGDAGVPPQVTAAQADLDAATAAAAAAVAAADECQTECVTGIDSGTAECAATCKPCSTGTGFCTFGEVVEYEGNPLFFPVDELNPGLGMCSMASTAECAKVPEQYGFNGWPWEHEVFGSAPEHNFFFTSQVQYWFQYDANMDATLDFTGDDDVWVFINGKLAVDIGGIHVPVNGSVTIDAAQGTLATTVSEPITSAGGETEVDVTTGSFTAAEFGLEVGGVYKINVFHAERRKEGSSFKLTLSGFEAAPSDCSAICGDGVLSFGEECDDGINDGGYGECAEGCLLGPFCGDGIVQGDEQCDNGPGGGEGCPNCRKVKIKMAK